MGKTLILKPLLRSPNSISFMLIIFTFQLIQTIRTLWFCHRSEPENSGHNLAKINRVLQIVRELELEKRPVHTMGP
jgi:hypothetical protein